MSNAEHHLVATGARVADSMPLVDRLLSLGTVEPTVDVRILTETPAISRLRTLVPSDVVTGYELHIPAAHAAAYGAALDPLITGMAERGVPDGEGGLWLAVHSGEREALDAVAALPAVPVEVEAYHVPHTFDRALVPTEADHPMRACVEWSTFWPAVPGVELGPHGKHAAVCLVVNAADPWDAPLAAAGYRVYVATEYDGRRRAAHLAAAAGLRLADQPP